MVFYGLHCDHCDNDWTVERPMDKSPTKGKCPECGKMGHRLFGNAGLQFKGKDWETNSHKFKRFEEKGWDKSTADEFLHREIDNSKDRMKSGGQHYKKMIISEEDAIKQGIPVKRVTDEKAKHKADATFKLRKHLDRKRG